MGTQTQLCSNSQVAAPAHAQQPLSETETERAQLRASESHTQAARWQEAYIGGMRGLVTWLDGRMGDRITGREAIGCGGNCEEKRGERAQSTQQSSTRAPAAAAAAAASRSAVATPEEQAGQERRDRWKGQGRGKAARLRRSRARWDGTRFGERERERSDSDKKARDSRAQHLLVLFAAVQSCRC